MLRFHRSMCLWLLCARHFSFSFLHSVAAVRPSVLTMFPLFFSYAHGRYALTGRFLRVLGDPRIT